MALIDEISTPIDWRDYPYGFVERYGFMFKSGTSSSIWDVLQIREPMCKVCFPGVTLEGRQNMAKKHSNSKTRRRYIVS